MVVNQILSIHEAGNHRDAMVEGAFRSRLAKSRSPSITDLRSAASLPVTGEDRVG